MRASTIDLGASLVLALLVGCGPASPTEEPAGPVATRGHEVRRADSHTDQRVDERPTARKRGCFITAEELAGSLRPIDSPLPSRAQLEAACSDPVEPLLELSLPAWPDRIVRGNALVELGLFPEDDAAMDRLLEVAVDEERPATDRTAALEGLMVAGDAVEPHVAELLPLLDHDRAMVQATAVRLLGPWSAARSEVQRLAEAEDTDFDVRRFARRALEAEASR